MKKKYHKWVERKKERCVYDCKRCGSWTANVNLYKKDICRN